MYLSKDRAHETARERSEEHQHDDHVVNQKASKRSALR